MKAKLIEQSLLLFEKQGFAETSIQEIVEACQVTKGTFYYYFKSKAELLYDIQLDYINDVIREQTVILSSSDESQQKIKRMISLLIEKIKSDGPNARIFFREMRHLPEEDLKVILEKRDQIRLNLGLVVKEGLESGKFVSHLHPDFVTFAILGMCNWSYSWFDPKGPEPEETLIQTYVDLLLNGMLPR
ncbi:MAG TPA: TetR/AcrR family transcriptional regulator [Candidatus Angelobacter sp.]|nr:TetR/AcrR family transcriptional regulator [Candidatus Angelobacter sp.]